MEPIASPRWAPAPPALPAAASPPGSLHLPPHRAASPDPIRGVSPSRFPALPLGPVVVASPQQHAAGLQPLGAVLQSNLPKQLVAPLAPAVPVAGHAPAMPVPGQCMQPMPQQVRYQSPGQILHPLQPMVSPRGYVVAPAPAAPTLPPTPEVMPRHRLVMAPSPMAQTMSAQNLQTAVTAEPVTSPIANHRLILQSHGSVPLIQSIYSPLRAPEGDGPSQESLAQQVKALQAARASAPPLKLSEALKRWPCPETPVHLQDEMELSDPPEADAMSVSAEPDEPIAPEEKEPEHRQEEGPGPIAAPAPAHERSGKAPRPTLSSSRSRTMSSRGSAQMRRLSLMPEVQEAAQQCRKELQQRAQELNAKDLRELRQLLRPPRQVKQVLDTICMLLGEKAGNKGYNWKKILTESLPNKLADFDPQAMSGAQRSKVLEALGDQDFSQEVLAKTHQPCIGLSRWCACISNFVSKSNHLVSDGKSFNAMIPTISVDSGGSAPSLKGAAKGSTSKGRSQSPGNRRAVNGKGKGRDPSPFVVEPDLRSLSSSELTKVSELKVIKPNVGEVVFHGLTDCTDLDVARDIVLKRGYVLVYPDQKNKPPPGEGLNKHATVTMYQCFPPGEPIRTLSEEAVQEYKDKIRRMTEENSACSFIDYDCQTGVWKFQVERF